MPAFTPPPLLVAPRASPSEELDVASDPDGRDRFAKRVEQSHKVVVGDELLVIDDGLKDRLVQLAQEVDKKARRALNRANLVAGEKTLG